MVDTQPNRITQQLSDLADGVAVIESFSHVVLAVATAAVGLALAAFISSLTAIRILAEALMRPQWLHLVWLVPIVGRAIGGWTQAGSVDEIARDRHPLIAFRKRLRSVNSSGPL